MISGHLSVFKEELKAVFFLSTHTCMCVEVFTLARVGKILVDDLQDSVTVSR